MKIYVGAPADIGAAGSGYVAILNLMNIIQQTRQNFPATFGGVSFWDASQAYMNARYDSSTKAILATGGSCDGAITYQSCPGPAWSSSGSYPGGSTVSELLLGLRIVILITDSV